MGTFAYTVACTFTDSAVGQRWMRWLIETHMADVIAAGAESAALVALDGEPPLLRAEVRYIFADRAAFMAYERDHAPRLRAEGLELFPLHLGLTYTRSTGEITAALTSGNAPPTAPPASA